MTKNISICGCICAKCNETSEIKNNEECKGIIKYNLVEKNKLIYLKNKEKMRQKYYEKKAKLIEAGIIKEKIPTRIDGKIRKDAHKEYNDNYNIKNKDKIILCECGLEYKFFNKCQHYRTKKHIDNLFKK